MTFHGNKLGRRAVVEYKLAALSGEFGQRMLQVKFGALADTVLAKVGTYSRGPRKGLPRGYLQWTKVVEGGWGNCNRYGQHPQGGVLRPGTRDWCVTLDSQCTDGHSANFIATPEGVSPYSYA